MNDQLNTTNPGINQNVKAYIKTLNDEEQSIIHYFARKYWNITRVEKLSIAKSDYHIAFLKPTKEISHAFNLYREVLLVFSSYDKFEPRSIDAIDSFDVQELRLEEICSFIISKDNNVATKLTTFLKTNQESRIIVPFTYQELTNNGLDDEYVPNKLRQLFYNRDLFGIQDPLKKDLYFFGRKELIHELVNKHLNSENSGIFGLRKTGKTSILYGVERALDRKQSVSLFIDCQTLHLKTWNEALLFIIDSLRTITNVKKTRLSDTELYQKDAMVAQAFSNDILNIYRNNKKRSILLIFDEIEHISYKTSISKEWREGDSFVKFWQILRSTYQTLRKDNVYTYLIAGTNPQCLELPKINQVDNPIFSQFQPLYIPNFTVEQTKEMLQRLGGYTGLIFQDEVIIRIEDDFGGHPLLMRQICSYIHRNVTSNRPVTITKASYEKYRKAYIDDENGFYQYAEMILSVLKDFYPDEYDMLTYLSLDDNVTFNGLANQEKAYIRHLLHFGIIQYDKITDTYYFCIEAIKDYLANKNRYRKLHLSETEKWKEIGERRNAIEPRLRRLVRIQLKASFGELLAVDKIKSALISTDSKNKEIIKRANAFTYKDYFDPAKVNIYLNTLFQAIKASYDSSFRYLFNEDIELFNSKTTILNKYARIDAHAKPISDADFETVRGALTWIENVLDEND